MDIVQYKTIKVFKVLLEQTALIALTHFKYPVTMPGKLTQRCIGLERVTKKYRFGRCTALMLKVSVTSKVFAQLPSAFYDVSAQLGPFFGVPGD